MRVIIGAAIQGGAIGGDFVVTMIGADIVAVVMRAHAIGIIQQARLDLGIHITEVVDRADAIIDASGG